MADGGVGEGMETTGGVRLNFEQLEVEQLSFEELVSALEALTDRLASGQIGIEEAADLYEQAERLHEVASRRLAKVQARIDALAVGDPPAGGSRPAG